MELTAKQRLFVSFYLGESAGNATDAARKAGYSSPDTMGRRLVRKGPVRAAIDARLDEVALTSNQILARLSEMAMGGVGDFLKVDDAGGVAFDFAAARRRGKLPLLKKYKADDKGTQIETHDPIRALDLLGKYRRLWSEQKDDDAGPIRVIVEYTDPDQAAPAAPESAEDSG